MSVFGDDMLQMGSGAASGSSFGPWGAAIGGGLGLLSSLFGNKPQQQTTQDPTLQKYLDMVRGAGMGAYNSTGASPTMSPDFLAAMRGLHGYSDQGNDALSILMGKNPGGASAAMNPYMSAMQPLWDRLTQQAHTGAQLASTSPFGIGGREGIATSNAESNIGGQQAQFNYGAFTDMMNRMQQTAQGGLMANQGLQSGGEWASMLPMQWQQMRMGLLTPGMASAGSTTTIPTQNNPFQAILGGGLAGYGAASGMGAGKQGNMGMGW